MAVSSSPVVLRFSQPQITGQGTRSAIELQLHNISNSSGGKSSFLCSISLNEERKRLGNTDSIRKLNKGTLTQTGGNDRLGHPTACVGGRSVDLGRILSGESSSSMSSPSSVGVNDNLTSGETGISLGSTNDEFSRGVQVDVAVITIVERKGRLSVLERDRFQSLNDNVVVDKVVHFSHGGGDFLGSSPGGAVVLSVLLLGTLGLGRFGVLSGDEDGVDLGGDDRPIFKLIVGDGDLGLSIGAEPPKSSVLTHIGKLLAELVGEKVGQGHAALGLIRGISKHDTLVTGTNIHVILSDVNSAGDIGRLLVNAHEDLAVVTRETLGLDRREIIDKGTESDLTHLVTDNFLVVEVGGGGDLAKDHNHVVFGGGLAGDLGHGVGGEAGVEDGIGDLIAELIGMSFVDGLGREEERACFNHDCEDDDVEWIKTNLWAKFLWSKLGEGCTALTGGEITWVGGTCIF